MIDEKFNELIKTIENSLIYQNYQHILKQVEVNNDINILVKDLKDMQKKIVHATSIGQDIKKLEKELDIIKQNLNNIPLYQSYIDASNEVNDLMKLVNIKIQNYINDLNI